jgi:hypothetical protein
MKLLSREPAVIIGIIAAVIMAVVQTLTSNGVIGADVSDTVAKALDPSSGWLIPIILGIVTRFFVFSPASAAELKAEAPG